MREWPKFLEAADPNDERLFQAFLEQHPCLIPGGEGTAESFGGHHGGWRNIVIAQPTVPGLNKKHPDFMWLSKNSEDIIPVLLEIEAPGKRWFTNKGNRTAKLTQAQDQLREWRQNIDNPAGRLQLGELYDFPQTWTLTHNLRPRYMLIYGRTAEFESRPGLSQRRSVVRDPDTEMMTYDRLRPLMHLDNAFTVRLQRDGTREVVAIPPTFALGPGNAEDLAVYVGWTRAVENNALLSVRRKRFLLRRIPYWQDLVRSREPLGPYRTGPYGVGDWE